MSENIARKNNKQFLTRWSILNLAGWIVGLFCVFLIQLNLEFDDKFSLWKTMLIWFPLGAGIGVFQWFKVKQFGINLFTWATATALGGSVWLTLYSWILNYASYDYRLYNIPYWIINTVLAIMMPVGGAIIGGIQSLVIRKHILRPDLWVRAYVVGLLVPPIAIPIAELVKSFFLEFLYSVELYILVDMRWLLFFSFLIIITSVFISILTGNILLKQSNINSVSTKMM